MKDIINSPDLAIALNYDGKSAPRITAKGEGLIAEQIIELAKEHDIPMHTDVAMVKILSRLSLGDEIPRELYLAVAEVIAFVYMLSGKQPGDKYMC
jgi:flagellar biosynthesis protein